MTRKWRLGGQSKWNGEGWDELPTGRTVWTTEEDGTPAPVFEMEDWFDDADLELIAKAPEMAAELASLRVRLGEAVGLLKRWTSEVAAEDIRAYIKTGTETDRWLRTLETP